MSNKITKARLSDTDNEVLKLVSLKLSAEKMKIVTSKEVIRGIIRSFGRDRDSSVENIINAIRNEV